MILEKVKNRLSGNSSENNVVDDTDSPEDSGSSDRRQEIEDKLLEYNVFSEPYNKWHDKWMEEFGENLEGGSTA